LILVDTGPLVALFDKSDDYHAACHAALKTLNPPLITTTPVLTEALYLLGFSWNVQDDLWEFITGSGLQVYDLNAGMLTACRELMRKYRDLPMDLADASLVTLADSEDIKTIFTLDHKDFRIYRTKKKKPFKLLPHKL
jgi:predicted nucleic acid-binding protein